MMLVGVWDDPNYKFDEHRRSLLCYQFGHFNFSTIMTS